MSRQHQICSLVILDGRGTIAAEIATYHLLCDAKADHAASKDAMEQGLRLSPAFHQTIDE
jgi:hypothetical protein